MKLICKKLNISVNNFLRVCGYSEITNPHTKKTSFARSLETGRFYPRFHIYAEIFSNQIQLNLHLDAKKPSYEGSSAHSGEYEGSVVEKEAQRIKTISEKFISDNKIIDQPLGFNPPASQKKSWFKKIFSFLKKNNPD